VRKSTATGLAVVIAAAVGLYALSKSKTTKAAKTLSSGVLVGTNMPLVTGTPTTTGQAGVQLYQSGVQLNAAIQAAGGSISNQPVTQNIIQLGKTMARLGVASS
jgi:hypothetical protein